jgi:hypothetical protein
MLAIVLSGVDCYIGYSLDVEANPFIESYPRWSLIHGCSPMTGLALSVVWILVDQRGRLSLENLPCRAVCCLAHRNRMGLPDVFMQMFEM